ncbi:MAG: efflux RND transporter permease subunit [Desulfopila sp.]|jgi:multidrug efflux pump subunit AcrB|nr:efflux RND transporter permease subunit [Desulfopila sp.]
MIRFFAGHPTAANLLMLGFLIAGILSVPRVLRETQPDFAASEVEIRLAYPGATAQEVADVICRRVEDAMDSVTFIEEIRADAREGVAVIVLEMASDGDFQVFKDDIETQIDTIDDFPAEVEEPVIREIGRTDPVISLLVSGPLRPADLKTYAENLKERMQEAGIALVAIKGFSERQFRVSLSETALRRLGINTADVVRLITIQSRDIPLGVVETDQRNILVRYVDQRRTAESLEQLVIVATPEGGEVLLGDIGVVQDTFKVAEDKVMMNGKLQALLAIEKTKSEDAIRLAGAVKTFVRKEKKLHPQMELTVTQDQTDILVDRLNMLFINGVQGLLLVFLVMWLFFNVRVSFWVIMGLPVSFLGAFVLVPYLGLSINMFTMVGMLMAIGLLMDDAIVVAENIMTRRMQGAAPLSAAVAGVKEVAPGIASSFGTTLFVLGPLAFIEGQIGNVLRVVPMMLILVLAVSLIEAFCILPAHLNHAMHHFGQSSENRFRRRFEAAFDWVRDHLLGGVVDVLLRWRYLFIVSIIGLFVVSMAMVVSGKIKFQGFPELEGDVVMARLLMTPGTPLAQTEEVVNHLLEALEKTNQTFGPQQPEGRDLVENVYVQYNVNSEAFENGPHVATVTVDLLTAEKRSGSIDAYLAVWRKEIGSIADVVSLTLSEPGFGPAGRPIEIRLRGKDLGAMKYAAMDLHAWFSRFEGVVNLSDDLRLGKYELRLKMRQGTHGIGIGVEEISQQLRTAFQGIEADTIQIGSESYEIEVKLNQLGRSSLEDLENFNLVLNDGTTVPLATMVTWKLEKGWARLARIDGMAAVTLRGDVDTRLINTNELIRSFNTDYLPLFQEKYPDISLTVDGSIKETRTTRMSMLKALLIGLIGIFFLLSFQFRSYTEPFIVMLSIPFALIGVIWGHGLMGVPISMPSLLGFIALAGIVVNDSILLVVFLKNARKEGLTSHEAAARASRARFRAVLLTSTTTIAGLLPLLFEKSLQAQILIPLVVSTTFGLMASTVLVLLAIPCMYLILRDFGLVENIAVSTKKNESRLL